jgi:hypothetical protein
MDRIQGKVEAVSEKTVAVKVNGQWLGAKMAPGSVKEALFGLKRGDFVDCGVEANGKWLNLVSLSVVPNSSPTSEAGTSLDEAFDDIATAQRMAAERAITTVTEKLARLEAFKQASADKQAELVVTAVSTFTLNAVNNYYRR